MLHKDTPEQYFVLSGIACFGGNSSHGCTGPAAHSRGSANAAEVSRLMDALEVLCIRGLSAASKRIAAGIRMTSNALST